MANMKTCPKCGEEKLSRGFKGHVDYCKGTLMNDTKELKNPVKEIIDSIIPPEPNIDPPVQEVKPEFEEIFEPQKESGQGTILIILILPFMALVGFLFFIMMRKGGDNFE